MRGTQRLRGVSPLYLEGSFSDSQVRSRDEGVAWRGEEGVRWGEGVARWGDGWARRDEGVAWRGEGEATRDEEGARCRFDISAMPFGYVAETCRHYYWCAEWVPVAEVAMPHSGRLWSCMGTWLVGFIGAIAEDHKPLFWFMVRQFDPQHKRFVTCNILYVERYYHVTKGLRVLHYYMEGLLRIYKPRWNSHEV